jgi:virginiamycin B lyase
LDPAGGVVVTGMFSHVMMRLDPADGTWTETAIPVDFANPRAVEIDDRGDWWVLLGVPEMIARYRVEEREWDTWDIGMYGHSLRLDGSGRVAFNGHFTRQPSIVGWLDVDAGRVSTVEVAESPAPEADHPMPYGLRVGPDGLIWGTELRGGRIFAVDPEGGATRVWSMPEPAAGPRRPALDDTGSLWIPEYAANRLTRFDPRTGLFDRHVLPMPDVLPYVVEVDRARGTVWVGTAAGDVVLSFDPSTRRFTTYPMPTEGALIRHLVVDESSGEVWAAYGAFPGVPPRIVRIQPSPGEMGG